MNNNTATATKYTVIEKVDSGDRIVIDTLSWDSAYGMARLRHRVRRIEYRDDLGRETVAKFTARGELRYKRVLAERAKSRRKRKHVKAESPGTCSSCFTALSVSGACACI